MSELNGRGTWALAAPPRVIAVAAAAGHGAEGASGRLAACIGSRDRVRAVEENVARDGLTAIARAADTQAAWRWVRSLSDRLAARRPATRVFAHLRYRHRTLARLVVDGSVDPVVIEWPYFGEALEAAHFHLSVQPTGTEECRVETIMFLQPPWFSALEKSIQRRVPAAISCRQGDDRLERTRGRRRVVLIDEWATEDWLVRSVESADRSNVGQAAARCGDAEARGADPFGPAADLLALRTKRAAEPPLRHTGREGRPWLS